MVAVNLGQLTSKSRPTNNIALNLDRSSRGEHQDKETEALIFSQTHIKKQHQIFLMTIFLLNPRLSKLPQANHIFLARLVRIRTFWWSIWDSNSWPLRCHRSALANWANTPRNKLLHPYYSTSPIVRQYVFGLRPKTQNPRPRTQNPKSAKRSRSWRAFYCLRPKKRRKAPSEANREESHKM